jgi:acyl transferase domain-containing protein
VRAAVERQDGSVAVAAVNGPENTVISGACGAVDAALRELAAEGIRFERLTVSHAFHSPLMDPMLEPFGQVAAGVTYGDPQIVMASDLTGALLQPGMVSAEYWRQHARQPVRFAAALEALYARGCRLFVEVGPRPILSGMGRRFLPDDATWLPVLRKGRSDWQQLLETVRELYTIGAGIDWAGFDRDYARRKLEMPTYPFERERCWVTPRADAASRCEGTSAAAPSWAEWLYEPRWQPCAPGASTPADSDPSAAVNSRASGGFWVLFADDGGAAAKLAAIVRSSGGRCALVEKGNRFEARAEGFAIDPLQPSQYQQLFEALRLQPGEPCRAVHFWGLDEPFAGDSVPAALDAQSHRACGSILYLVQALASLAAQSIASLAVVTRGAQRVGDEDRAAGLVQALAWGLGRVAISEHPELRCSLIDLDPDAAGLDASLRVLHHDVLAPGAEEDQIAIRAGARHVLRLTAVPAVPVARRTGYSPDGTYLITGGLSGLGLQVAERLSERGAKRIALVGRRAPSPAAVEAIRKLEARGVSIRVVPADVADRAALSSLLDQLERDGAPLRGVVHSAGTVDDGVLAHQTWERFRAVMAAKVQGAWNLHALTAPLPLEFFVLFSSSASLLGPAAQGNYAAANAFLDALAHYRRAQGLPALAVNWGPWSEVGLAARGGLAERAQLQGLGAIDPGRGLSVLEHLIASGRTQAAVLPANWAEALAGPDERTPTLLKDLASRAALPAREPSRPVLADELAAAPPHKHWPMILAHVTEHARRVLGAPSSAQLDPQQGLRDLGLDSLMAVELRNRLQRAVGRPLRSTLAFDCPTIEAVGRHLMDDVLALTAPSGARADEETEDGDDLLAAIERLSDDQAEKLLARKAITPGV